jgi:hypothetical protein
MNKNTWISVSGLVLAVCVNQGISTSINNHKIENHQRPLDPKLEQILAKGLSKAPLFADASPCQMTTHFKKA